MLDNAQALMGRAWHVIATTAGVTEEPTAYSLLGRCWWVSGSDEELRAVDDRGASPWGLRARYGLVWLAPLQPPSALPVLPELEDPGFATGILTRRTPVSAGVLVDNFLDVSHFSYLHRATFGRAAPVTVAGTSVERDGWTVRLTHATDLHLSADPIAEATGAAGADSDGAPTDSWRVATYTVLAPFVVHLQMEFPATGARSAATLVCVPENSAQTTVHVVVAWPADDPIGLEEQLHLSRDVLAEDLDTLELMADPRLELSLRAELHTRADRASVEYRRLIADHLADTGGSAPAALEVVGAARR